MQQQLSVNLTIPVPEDSVLIKRVELQELQENQLDGVWWNMKDLEKRLGKKHEWIKENILYPPFFKKKLDINNGGFVYYPEKQGHTWSFHAKKMVGFLDVYFADIHTGIRTKGKVNVS